MTNCVRRQKASKVSLDVVTSSWSSTGLMPEGWGILVLIWRTLRERTKYAGSREGQKCVVFGTSVRAGGGLGKNGQFYNQLRSSW